MASAKQNRINRMIDVLENSSSWVSSSMLAGLLGASERSIRNYVAEVNETGTRHIESSKEGYRLATAAPAAASASASPCEGVNTLPANADSGATLLSPALSTHAMDSPSLISPMSSLSARARFRAP